MLKNPRIDGKSTSDCKIALTTITQLQDAKTNQWGLYKQALKETIGKYLYTQIYYSGLTFVNNGGK
ncbi:hypothetical protein HQN88_06765 [Paenibacillus qinlingensis]|nr:hypothetical protein [Paenibacillus qinlingensis]